MYGCPRVEQVLYHQWAGQVPTDEQVESNQAVSVTTAAGCSSVHALDTTPLVFRTSTRSRVVGEFHPNIKVFSLGSLSTREEGATIRGHRLPCPTSRSCLLGAFLCVVGWGTQGCGYSMYSA